MQFSINPYSPSPVTTQENLDKSKKTSKEKPLISLFFKMNYAKAEQTKKVNLRGKVTNSTKKPALNFFTRLFKTAIEDDKG